MCYLLTLNSNTIECKNPGTQETQEIHESKYSPKSVYIKSKSMYLCLDTLSRFFYLSKYQDEAELFLLEYIKKPRKTDSDKIRYHKDKIALRTRDHYYLGLKYTITPKPIYDVSAINDNINNTCILQLKSNKKGKLYTQFYNNYNMSIDSSNTLFSSKNSNNIFFFSIKLKPNNNKEKTY